MKLSSSAIESIEAIIRKEIEELNINDSGKPKTLSEMEDITTGIGQKFTQKILKELLENEALKTSPEKKNCPHCERKLKLEGKRTRKLLTTHGTQIIRRNYFRCKYCHYSEYPTDRILGMLPGKLSAKAAEKVCILATIAPFEQVTDLLNRLVNLTVSADCIEKTSERAGYLIYDEECNQSDRANELLDESNEHLHNPPERIYLQIDGSMLNTREEKWKENKLAMAFCEFRYHPLR